MLWKRQPGSRVLKKGYNFTGVRRGCRDGVAARIWTASHKSNKSTVRKQKELNAGAQFTLTILSSLGHRHKATSDIRGDFSTSINPV